MAEEIKPLTVEELLEQGKRRGFTHVIVIGLDGEGAYDFVTNLPDAYQMIGLLESVKHKQLSGA